MNTYEGNGMVLIKCVEHHMVQMLTPSSERYQKIQKEAPAEFQKYLVQVTKYQAAQNCKVLITASVHKINLFLKQVSTTQMRAN